MSRRATRRRITAKRVWLFVVVVVLMAGPAVAQDGRGVLHAAAETHQRPGLLTRPLGTILGARAEMHSESIRPARGYRK